jgi:hypothetical protein
MHDTADIRDKMLKLWKLLDENKVSATQVRLHIGIARTILETLKVEMAAAHLNKAHIDAVPVHAIRLVRDKRQQTQ